MSDLYNPFLVYGYESPEFFCDREAETKALCDSLVSGNNITLLSPRRIGKSGLIHNAFYYLRQQDYACFYVDIYSTNCLSDFVKRLGVAVLGKLDTPVQKAEGFITRFFRSCQVTFSVDAFGSPQVSLNILPQQEERTLEEIFAYIAQSGRRCFIALDEFQQVAEYPEKNVEALLRTYIQQTHTVQFIFSGSKLHMMSEMFDSPKHPFYRSTERIPLYPLDEDKYYAFAAERLSPVGVDLPKMVFHTLYTMVDGVTWYVQSLLNRLYRMRPAVVTEENIMEAVRQVICSELDGYKHLYHLLTRTQAAVLEAVAREKLVREPQSGNFLKQYNLKSASGVQRALDSLVRSEYVYRTDEGYIVYDRFFAIWLREKDTF